MTSWLPEPPRAPRVLAGRRPGRARTQPCSFHGPPQHGGARAPAECAARLRRDSVGEAEGGSHGSLISKVHGLATARLLPPPELSFGFSQHSCSLPRRKLWPGGAGAWRLCLPGNSPGRTPQRPLWTGCRVRVGVRGCWAPGPAPSAASGSEIADGHGEEAKVAEKPADATVRSGQGSLTRRLEMSRRQVRLLLLLAALALSVSANEGSVTGSCHCDQRISSSSPPNPKLMEHFRKHLRAYHRCTAYIRFRLHSRSVCGGNHDPWVHELLRCFDRGECGHAHWKSLAHRKPLPSRSTQIPKYTEEASAHLPSTAQTHLPPTLPPGAHANKTTTAPLSQSLEVGPEAGQNQKQLEEIVGPAAGRSAMVPVLTLLAITFLLTGALMYVLCKRRRGRSPKYSSDLQLYHTRVAQ